MTMGAKSFPILAVMSSYWFWGQYSNGPLKQTFNLNVLQKNMRAVPCCDVLNMQFPTAKLAFLYHHPPTLHSAFFCLNWLTLTHINSSAAVTNAVLSLSFYLKTQTQDCQFYFTISIPLYFSQICTVLSEVILRPFLCLFMLCMHGDSSKCSLPS